MLFLESALRSCCVLWVGFTLVSSTSSLQKGNTVQSLRQQLIHAKGQLQKAKDALRITEDQLASQMQALFAVVPGDPQSDAGKIIDLAKKEQRIIQESIDAKKREKRKKLTDSVKEMVHLAEMSNSERSADPKRVKEMRKVNHMSDHSVSVFILQDVFGEQNKQRAIALRSDAIDFETTVNEQIMGLEQKLADLSKRMAVIEPSLKRYRIMNEEMVEMEHNVGELAKQLTDEIRSDQLHSLEQDCEECGKPLFDPRIQQRTQDWWNQGLEISMSAEWIHIAAYLASAGITQTMLDERDITLKQLSKALLHQRPNLRAKETAEQFQSRILDVAHSTKVSSLFITDSSYIECIQRVLEWNEINPAIIVDNQSNESFCRIQHVNPRFALLINDLARRTIEHQFQNIPSDFENYEYLDTLVEGSEERKIVMNLHSEQDLNRALKLVMPTLMNNICNDINQRIIYNHQSFCDLSEIKESEFLIKNIRELSNSNNNNNISSKKNHLLSMNEATKYLIPPMLAAILKCYTNEQLFNDLLFVIRLFNLIKHKLPYHSTRLGWIMMCIDDIEQRKLLVILNASYNSQKFSLKNFFIKNKLNKFEMIKYQIQPYLVDLSIVSALTLILPLVPWPHPLLAKMIEIPVIGFVLSFVLFFVIRNFFFSNYI